MFKRVFKLFQIARKLSTSGAVNTINEIHTFERSGMSNLGTHWYFKPLERPGNYNSTGHKAWVPAKTHSCCDE